MYIAGMGIPIGSSGSYSLEKGDTVSSELPSQLDSDKDPAEPTQHFTSTPQQIYVWNYECVVTDAQIAIALTY